MKHTALVAVAAVGLLAGCQEWPRTFALAIPNVGDEEPTPEQRLVDALRHETIVQHLGPLYRTPSPSSPIVRCEAIESLVSLGDRAVPALRQAADSLDAVKRRNARRTLARMHHPLAQGLLVEVVTDRRQCVEGRMAAVRDIQTVWPDAAPRLLASLLGHDRIDEPALVCYVMECLAETRDPALADLFRARCGSRDGEVRLIALRCLRRLDLPELPEEAIDGCADPLPGVRLEAMRLVGDCPDQRAVSAVLQATRDHSTQVQAEAVRALGSLGGPDGRDRLVELLRSPCEAVRTSAVDALGRLRDVEGLWRARRDRSWRVRKLMVTGLGQCGVDAARDKLLECLDDRSLYVQLEAVEAARQAPIAQGAPILLTAVGKETYLVRQKAWQALRAHVSKDLHFDVPANRTVRDKQVAAVRTWWAKHGPHARGESKRPSAPASAPSLRTDVLAQVALLGCADLVQARRALGRLKELGRSAIPIIEKDVLGRNERVPPLVLGALLPALSPSYYALRCLESRHRRKRQQGAQILAELKPPDKLSPYVARRLSDHLASEPDQLVWHYALAALARDAPDRVSGPLKAGLAHQCLGVRRDSLACVGHLSVKALTPETVACLDDTSRSVKITAARALGRLDPGAAVPALRQALVSRDRHFRLVVAKSLAQLGQTDGVEHLVLGLADPDPTMRRMAAEALGDVGDNSVVPSLVRCLRDRRLAVRREAVRSLEKLTQVTFRLDDKGRTRTSDDMVRQWQRWWAAQRLAHDSNRSRR